MIDVVCDACERPFQVPDEQAGAKAPCPRCGDIKRIPGQGGPGAAAASATTGAGGAVGAAVGGTDRALAMGLPARDGPEATVLEVRGSVFRSRPVAYALNLLVLLGALAGSVVLALTPATLPFAIGTLLLALVCGFIWARWAVLAHAERLTVTNKRVIFARGLLSKSTIEMLHRTVQDIEIDQTFTDRLLGIGRVSISNAGQEDDEIIIRAVPDPYRIRQVIDAYRVM
ncbi:MAG: PH domain-containing protein [Phycisphaerales bacterium]